MSASDRAPSSAGARRSSRPTTSARTSSDRRPGRWPRVPERARAHRRRRQPRRHRRARRRARGRRRAGPRPAPDGEGGAGRRLHRRVRLGAGRTATTSSSRWTPTVRTPPSSCRGCSPPCDRADLVLGSRWVPGGSGRQLADVARAALARRQPLHPAGAGRRPARRHRRLPRVPARGAREASTTRRWRPQGYCFQVDLAWRAVRAGYRVAEVPITFAERERGESKMSGSIVREALWRVTVWGAQHRARQLRGAVRTLRRQT